MRKKIFCGISKTSNKWVEGSLSVEYDDTCHIVYWDNALIEPENNFYDMVQKSVEVKPETVSEYIGLKDVENKLIFEGDILSSNDDKRFVVEFINGGFRLRQIGFDYKYIPDCTSPEEILKYHLVVIGNIHNEPELLKSL